MPCLRLSNPPYPCSLCCAQQACTTTVRRIGLCTNWLERKCLPFLSDVCVLSTAARLPIFHKPTKDFILPGSTGVRRERAEHSQGHAGSCHGQPLVLTTI
jgi:hypothetical protein